MKGLAVGLVLAALAGCSKVEESATTQNDSLAVLPVQPDATPDSTKASPGAKRP